MAIINIQMLGRASNEQKAPAVNRPGKDGWNARIILNEKSTEDWGHAGERVLNRKK